MALNPFFLQGSKNEQGLIQDLINEQLKIYGVDVHYIPRKYINENTIIKEVIESEYSNAYPIEAYVESYDGYSGQGTILSKFGIQELDDLVLTISKDRFEFYIYPLIKNLPDIKLPDRPKEGDLIYFPLGDRLFEIKYVEHEKPFYQLQNTYVYELRCELYRYEAGENIDTGIDNIDDNVIDEGYIQTLQMIGVGETASAFTSKVDGGIRFIDILNRGSGYTSAPRVAISSAPSSFEYRDEVSELLYGGVVAGTQRQSQYIPGSIEKKGIRAEAVALMIDGIVDFCENDKKLYRVQDVVITNPGAGYSISYPPKIAFIGGGGSGVAATAVIGNGLVGVVTITNSGSGYITPPNITFSGISSISAAATCVLNANGGISTIYITNSGLGYSEPPEMIIEGPNIISGYGSYQFNESIIGTTSNTKGKVKRWNINTKVLEVSNINGYFIKGETLVGQKSGASYVLNNINTDNLSDPGDSFNKSDKFAQNNQIQIEANEILDFSDANPFGTP